MGLLTRFSLKNATVIFLSIFLILAGGWYSAVNMKSEAMPDIDVPFMWMIVPYPGATPHDVSKGVTEPLEKSLQGLHGLKNITAEAYQNYGVVVLEFDFSADLDKASQDINEAVNRTTLPKEALEPEVHKANVNDEEMIRFAVSGPGKQEEIARYVSETIKPKLQTIDGIDEIRVAGVTEKKIFIKLNPDKMKEYQVTPDTVKQALQFANLSIPAGQVTIGSQLLPIEVKKDAATLDDIKNIRLVSVDTSKLFKDAFGAMGSGFSQFGDALKQLSTGMQQGFGAVGQAQTLTQTQIQLLSGIQSLMALISEDQAKLQALILQGAPKEQTAGMETKIAAEKEQLQQLSAQLAAINKQAAAMGGQSAGSPQQSAGSTSKSSSVSLDGSPEAKVVTLGDIAEVSYGYEEETFLSRTNGKPGVSFSLTRQSGANVVEVTDKAKEIIADLNLPQGYTIEPLFDMSVPIKQSVKSMVKEGLLGAFFAVVVIFFFLRNFQATIVAIISIPLSVFASFIVLKWLGFTINIMTLSGMAVAVGRVVDDSIVVIENIYRRLAGEKGTAELVREATGEVASAITSSTLTTIAVFGPLALVSGVIGKVFTPFAVTVVVALLFSLLVAVTVVPLMGRLLLLGSTQKERSEGRLRNTYGEILAWSLSHKTAVILVALLALGISIFFGSKIGTNFLPQDKVRIYMANMTMPVGASLQKTDAVAQKVEAVFKSEPAVKTYQTSVEQNGTARFFVVLNDEVDDTKSIAQSLRTELKKVGGARDISLQELGGPGGISMMKIIVNGNDLKSIKEGGGMILEAVKQVPGLANISSNMEDVKPQIEVKINEVSAAAKGLSPIMVAGTIRSMITGEKVGNVEIQGEPTDLMLSLSGGEIPDLEAIKKLELLSMTGEKVPVMEVAEVSMKPGPTSIQRRNLQQFITVEALITDSNAGKVDVEVKQSLKLLQLPEGVTYYFEGNTEMMAQGFRDMGIAMAVAVLLVFIVMVGTFGNARAPLAILVSLPMAIIGAVAALSLTGQELGMPAMVGGLMLIGIVVTNAIVLVDRVQKQIINGLSVDEALVEAGKTRLRPIIMTAITTVFALLPMALMPAEGALISKAMAWVVIGGLTTSTLLTLILVPVVYKIFEDVVSRFTKGRALN